MSNQVPSNSIAEDPVSNTQNPEVILASVANVAATASFHSGPIPNADEMVKYGNYDRTIHNRIITMAEHSLGHRIDLEKEVLSQERLKINQAFRLARLPQWFAGIGMLSVLGMGIYGIVTNNLTAGIIGFLSTGILALSSGLFKNVRGIHYPSGKESTDSKA
jgi:uncharacterized membrane protein